MRVLIVDDEELARKRLQELLAQLDEVEVIGEAVDGPTAIAAIDTLRPDIAFLDVQMPGATGLEILSHTSHSPAVIFTTAHDRYAVAAFELQAIDYLLKPFGLERVAEALSRARRALRSDGPSTTERLRVAMGKRPEHILVRDRGKLIPVATRDIVRLASEDDYTRAFVEGRSHLLYLPLHEFEQVLDPDRFVRIHRSHVIALSHVRQMIPDGAGRYIVEMDDGTKLPVSRARSKELRERAF